MVLNRIAEQEGVTVTDADVEAEMVRVAAARGMTPEALKAEMIRDEEAPNRLKNSLKLRRALAAVVAAARITEPPPRRTCMVPAAATTMSMSMTMAMTTTMQPKPRPSPRPSPEQGERQDSGGRGVNPAARSDI